MQAASQMTDYSVHLIAARKALATAEAHAALRQWRDARVALHTVSEQATQARLRILTIEEALDTPLQSGADK